MLFGFVWRSLELYGVVGVVWRMNKGGKFLKKLVLRRWENTRGGFEDYGSL